MTVSKNDLRDALAAMIAESKADVEFAKEQGRRMDAWTFGLFRDGTIATAYALAAKFGLENLTETAANLPKKSCLTK